MNANSNILIHKQSIFSYSSYPAMLGKYAEPKF